MSGNHQHIVAPREVVVVTDHPFVVGEIIPIKQQGSYYDSHFDDLPYEQGELVYVRHFLTNDKPDWRLGRVEVEYGSISASGDTEWNVRIL